MRRQPAPVKACCKTKTPAGLRVGGAENSSKCSMGLRDATLQSGRLRMTAKRLWSSQISSCIGHQTHLHQKKSPRDLRDKGREHTTPRGCVNENPGRFIPALRASAA